MILGIERVVIPSQDFDATTLFFQEGYASARATRASSIKGR